MSTQHNTLRARLEAKEKRPLDRVPKPIATAPPAPISISRAHEVSAFAVGLLVLRDVENTGRTRLQEQAIGDALQRVTEHLNAEQMMRLEVEAYEIVDWLVGETDGAREANFVAKKNAENIVHYDPSSSIPDIVRAAVSQKFDLAVTYYSGRRMEMNRRVISPKAIAAEVYVRAWCHERRDERIFRMGRIRSAVPVNGQAINNPHFEHAVSEEQAVQQSLEWARLSYEVTADRADTTAAPAEPPSTAERSDAPSAATKEDDEPLTLQPTPTDEELLIMERAEQRAQDEKVAAEDAAAKAAERENAQDENDTQMSFL